MKEKELEFYQKTLKELLFKMSVIQQEIKLTNTIIDIIKSEKVECIAEYIHNKDNEREIKT